MGKNIGVCGAECGDYIGAGSFRRGFTKTLKTGCWIINNTQTSVAKSEAEIYVG